MILRVVRFKFDRFLGVLDRSAQVAHANVGVKKTQVVVKLSDIRFEFDCLVVICQRLVVAFEFSVARGT